MPALTGNRLKGGPHRLALIEAAALITVNDRDPLERRLDAAEVAGAIDAPERWLLGLDTRLNALEAVVW
jgi:hypothetical protein